MKHPSGEAPLSVLLIEDETLLGQALEAALIQQGHRVTVAESALVAFQLAAHDVVICDIGLPDASGFEVVEKLRARGDDSAFIFTSGSGTPEQLRAAMRLGAQEFLVKPFRLQEVMDVVERVHADKQRWRTRESKQLQFTVRFDDAAEAARRVGSWLFEADVSPSTRLRVATALTTTMEAAGARVAPGTELILTHA